MEQVNQIQLRISYGGTEYACRPDMRTLMMIEERVLLHKLASALVRGFDEVPATHLIWVVYCLLFCAGARVTADEVRQNIIAGHMDAKTLAEVVQWIISEVYGPAPRKSEEEEDEDPKT